MPLPFSKSQIQQLGKRLVASEAPAEEDLAALSELLLAYDDMLEKALEIVRDLGFSPTSRIKNTGTILEKLARQGGHWLKSVQDLAGMRIVLDGGRNAQDHAVREIVQAFSSTGREPKVIDRRLEPSYGYRAVHVVAYLEDMPVEIQIRTLWQHEWADMFEKLADRIGRGIRYGEKPSRLASQPEEPFSDDPAKNEVLRELRRVSHEWHVAMTRSAVAVSDLIDVLEGLEARGLGEDEPEVQETWATVREDLAEFRERIKEIAPVSNDSDVG